MSEFEIGEIGIVHESVMPSKPKCEVLEYDGGDNSYLVKGTESKFRLWINTDKLLKL